MSHHCDQGRADPDVTTVTDGLLPRPHGLRTLGGCFQLVDGVAVHGFEALEPPERAALERFRAYCAAALGVEITLGGAARRNVAGVHIRIGPTAAEGPGDGDGAGSRVAQKYALRVAPDAVELRGASATGVLHGIQTLTQLAMLAGRQWPGLEIEDAPDFAARGVSYDVSRGRVPTLATLEELVDRLALLKVNQLQLYVEHTFAFAFDPAISAGCSPLTPDEIRELDAYCVQRRIELVPSLASCGHMGRILSLPQYRHLAEISPERGWQEMTWRERVRGLTLDVTNPESRTLLRHLYDEYLPLFSSRRVNVCCDETYDLGKGRGKSRADQIGVAGLLLEHVGWLRELCGRHDKQIMVWGDMLRKHPELLARLPSDVIVLNWGYEANEDYNSTGLFRAAGLTTYVCPGSSTWNRFVNDIDTAEINIRGHAVAGRRLGAVGLLSTDWGDDGHAAPPAAAWHPLALGAALAWNADGPASKDFDAAFGRLFLGDGGAAAVAAWRQALAASTVARIWPMFYAPLVEPAGADAAPLAAPSKYRPAVAGPLLPADRERLARFDDAALERWRASAEEAARVFAAIAPRDPVAARDRDEMAVALRLHALAARRFLLARRLAAAGGTGSLAAGLDGLADALQSVIPVYETLWLARHKPACLHEVTAVLRGVADEARALAEGGASR